MSIVPWRSKAGLNLPFFSKCMLKCISSQTNVLVGRVNSRPIAWISDFDFSGELRFNGTVPTTETEAYEFVAPEFFLTVNPTREERQIMLEKGDIYAFGLTIHEVVCVVYPQRTTIQMQTI
jgi:hypothetical protein